MTERESKSGATTDQDLVAHFDGEASSAVSERVIQAELHSAEGTDSEDAALMLNKLASMDALRSVVCEHIDTSADFDAADDIADWVMSNLDLKLEELDLDVQEAASVPAANDNSQKVYKLALAAAAIAAGLFFWSKTAPEADLGTSADPTGQPVAMATTVAPLDSTRSGASTRSGGNVEVGPGQADDDDGDSGVEIATVDFGSNMGSVFHVAGGNNSAGSTTVLWVTDNDADDEEEL